MDSKKLLTLALAGLVSTGVYADSHGAKSTKNQGQTVTPSSGSDSCGSDTCGSDSCSKKGEADENGQATATDEAQGSDSCGSDSCGS